MDRPGVYMWMSEDDALDYVRDTHQGSVLGPLSAWRALYRYYVRRSEETGMPMQKFMEEYINEYAEEIAGSM